MILTSQKSGQPVRIKVHESKATRGYTNVERGKLSFRVYGETMVLKGIYGPGMTDRLDLKTSHREMELVKSIAPGATVAETSVNFQ